MKEDRRDFLLEINVEELPTGYIEPALKKMRQTFLKEFGDARISYDREEDLFVGGTKDSLVFSIKDVSERQEIKSERVWGPPKNIAFDEKNNPTKEALGFAKSQGVEVEDLRIEKRDPKALNPYVVIDKKLKSSQTRDILQEIIPRVIKDISFPKSMRWDDSGLKFARPIESVVALFGKDNIPIRLGNVPQKKIKPTTPAKYLKKIRFIYIDERKNKIKNLILSTAKKLKADQYIDKELLEEVTFMVNTPVVFSGEFDKKFLALPEDVLKASMSKYQRIFPVSKKGRLINRFIAVIDGKGRDIKGVRKNYENILEAKLKDSLFFFDEDTKKPFSENISKLKYLIFQKDLGNMFEKIERLEKLCSFICEKLNLKEGIKTDIKRAARLSKLDLVTHMVGEFPSLQGVMGGEYALKSREKKEVSTAIREHYLPQGMNDKLPLTLEGAILAISDRIDNVVGFLGTGLDTSGSFDPFGIRRNTQGLIQIIKDKSLRFNIDELIQKTVELYRDKLQVSTDPLKNKIVDYIKERIEFLSGQVKRAGLKEAVLEVRCFDIVDVFKRIADLSSISSERYFLEAAKVVERTSNILKGAKEEEISKVDEGLFKEDLERRVWKAYLNIKDRIQDLVDKERYKEATREYGQAFFKVLHDFFDKVLVNVDDKSLRSNRLAMMKAINRLYTEHIADLAKLPQIVVEQ